MKNCCQHCNLWEICTNLIDIVRVDDGVEARVEIVEEVDHLEGGGIRGHVGEAYDVTEVDGDTVEVLSNHGVANLQLVSNSPGQHLVEELLGLKKICE